jgi:1-deoxy-D-xylulose 5-phosphate reductoisomerase
VTVSAFLEDRLQFGDIPRLIRAACEAHTAVPVSTIDGVLAADKWAREWTNRRIAERATSPAAG